MTEPLNLRIKDIDLKLRRLDIFGAKGGKGRAVLFPECLIPALEQQLNFAKTLAADDVNHKRPVALPGLLGKKYPNAAFTQRWGWLFPSHTLCRDSRARIIVRWRCHENNVQLAVRVAARKCATTAQS